MATTTRTVELAGALYDALYFWAEDFPHEGFREDSDHYRGHCRQHLDEAIGDDLSALMLHLDASNHPAIARQIDDAFGRLRRFADASDNIVGQLLTSEWASPLSTEIIAERAGDDGFGGLNLCYSLLRELKPASDPETIGVYKGKSSAPPCPACKGKAKVTSSGAKGSGLRYYQCTACGERFKGSKS